VGGWGGQVMGEGVGQGVGVGKSVILVFFGVWKGRVFSFFDFFFRGRPWGWAGFCVGVCEQGGCPPWCGCCLEVSV
jgi:hypothetical protein